MSGDIFANLPRAAQELGPPVARYRDRPGLSLFRTALGVALRLGIGTAVVWLGVRDFARRDDDAGASGVVLLVLGLAVGLVCFVSGLGRVALALSRRRGGGARGVVHCPRGLVCALPSNKYVVAAWDEIDSVWDHGRRFRTRGGAEVVLPESLEGLPVLVELLFQETFQRLSVCASAVLLGGRAVEFGPLTLTRDEIAAGERRVPWAAVGGVDVAWGRLRVLRKGERRPALEVPLAKVRNPHALLAVAERLREGGFGSIVIGPRAPEEEV